MPSTPFAPFEAYGYSKAKAEKVVERERANGLVVSSLRPRTIVGSGRLELASGFRACACAGEGLIRFKL